ncbi:MAG: alpha/beta fold hydrolase, partial [Acidimicrobiia bacterium]|nr:alpha/beta fold hydrolase [Acidimicrobiia bacterium]
MTELATRHGVMWVRTFGAGPVRVVALHGFTLHGGMYEHLAGVADTTVAAPDLPGHGKTAVTPITTRAAVDAVADLLGAIRPQPVLL